MTENKKEAASETADRLEEAMDRYLEIEKKVRRFPPRRRFVVVPTADKWCSDPALLELDFEAPTRPRETQSTTKTK